MIHFQNTYFEIIFFSEKLLVPIKMVWLKVGPFKGLPLPKLVTIVYLEDSINHMLILKLENNFSTLSFHNQEI